MAKSLEALIQHEVVRWARVSAGLGVEDVAARLHVSSEVLDEWETGQSNPTLSNLQRLAEICKRPLAVFFLPKPPKELPTPTDFRRLPSAKRSSLSPEFHLALRRAQRL